ncbi:MAG: hypothetical protein R3E56_14970 [Burkholderiaceae bacterium]
MRLYAEDPAKNSSPARACSPRWSSTDAPHQARVDGWVERGTEVPAWYDPMLAKLIVTADTRELALGQLVPRWTPHAWPASRPTSITQVVRDPVFREGRQITRFLSGATTGPPPSMC